LIILDELGYLSFSQSSEQLLFSTAVKALRADLGDITTNLSFFGSSG
jgi:DNA replication protein DnaC